ncbi:MAG: insulinase family protein [Saccharospirillaceae bacterium]|nr:insulinase family protein [Saccharospirillaceae bacterium]MCD8531066.1 insulinase family protein [Saccharospirillaceae bacterium]
MLSPRYWTFLLIVLGAIVFSMIKFSAGPELVVSPADTFKYRYLTLDNGMKVLLVNTPDADKAAAAVSVDAGSGDDPKGREGLAHFLEHMLFLGTEPYPEAGEYQAYISRHGGSHNAFTAHSQTTYFFDIDHKAFSGALDRFAPFFISPTFDEAYVDREKNAVHAEYSSKLKDDFRRIYSAEKQAMNPEHPYASFATGNLDTLSDRADSKIRDDLLTFYNNHYSADRMTLVLASKDPLDQLESWAKSHFSAVPDHQTVAREANPPLFIPGQLPLDMNIEPVKEIRRLQFTFPMPETQTLYAYKPVQVLSNLIGHEGEGSLLALLKEKGWAEGLSAGRSLSTPDETTLVVQIQLTKLGLLHTENITQALMHYISLLKQQPLPPYLLTEQQQLSDLSFRFQEQSRLSDYVVRLSSNMLVYPAEDIIYGDYRWQPISQQQLQPYLDALSAKNMLRTLIAPKIATETIDPWYGTAIRIRPGDYRADSVNTDGLDQLTLPAPNPFIPTDFTLHADAPQATPEALINEPGRLLWYYPEHEFAMPKARVLIQLQQASVQNSARQRVLAQLYSRTVNEALNTYSYPAYLAGLTYSLNASGRGLELSLGGYQHKLPELLKRVLSEMDSFTLSEEDFGRYQASLQRTLENQLKNKPFERELAVLKNWLYDPSFDKTELLAALADVSLSDVQQYAATFRNELAIQMYVHGQLSKVQAQELAAIVNARYPANAAQVALPQLLRVPEGQHQKNLTLDHQDTAIVLYVQGQEGSDRNRARYALLGQILSAPYYQTMRTEQQLGYIVFATPFPQQTIPGLAFIVQSPEASPQTILDSSLKFFSDFEQQLGSMSEEEFNSYRQGLSTLLLEKPKNMAEKVARFWRDIEVLRYSFNTNEAIAAEVQTLSRDEIRALYQNAILERGKPWLMITQGGAVQDWPTLDTLTRDSLPRFERPQPEQAAVSQ